MLAAGNGKIDAVRMLLAAGADVNLQDKRGSRLSRVQPGQAIRRL